ncbi:hypothetical protein U8291_13940 [Pseudomonas sp. A2]|uniref:hypothetical protein n=1 Tax=Pseudomonas sp. A2 TaxID=107445 RepID=UPI002D13C297|nr:hypothetical protein [Pseudomonas sp. A2]MEB3438117.1 hypothetical protein [Pseudomonas sp. A2]
MRAIHTATAFSLAILAGCSAQPKAFYETSPTHGTKTDKDKSYEGDWEGLPKFTLAKSHLVIDFKDKDKERPVLPQMISVPAEALPDPEDAAQDIRTRFMLRQDDAFGVDTHLSVTKIDNTDLLSSIGTEVEDKRVKYVEALGSLATGVIGAMALMEGSELPISIDSYKILKNSKIARNGGIAHAIVKSPDGNRMIHLQAKFGPIKDDAIDNLVFANKAREHAQETIFHSACRSVTVVFYDGPLAGQQFGATVADPRYVETVRFPEKGSVVFHTACGANTTSSPSGTSSTLDLVNAVIAQSKTVREAWETSKSTEDASKDAAAQVAMDKRLAAEKEADAKAKAAGNAAPGR